MPAKSKAAHIKLFYLTAWLFTLLLLYNCSSNDNSSVEDLCIPPQDTIQEALDQNPIMVDIRDSASFACFHIPGSVNIPGKGLFHKTFLKNRQVILITSGFKIHDALQTAVEAKRHGIRDIKVMQGGIQAWHEAGGEIARSPTCSKGLYEIPPRSLLHLLLSRESRPALLGIGTCRSIKALFPDIQVICMNKEELHAATPGKNLKFTVKELRQSPLAPPVIAVDNMGESQTAIDNLRTRIGLKQFYYLKGGLRALAQAYTAQKQMAKANGKKSQAQACD